MMNHWQRVVTPNSRRIGRRGWCFTGDCGSWGRKARANLLEVVVAGDGPASAAQRDCEIRFIPDHDWVRRFKSGAKGGITQLFGHVRLEMGPMGQMALRIG